MICQQPSHDLVSAFHEEPTDPDRGEREQWKSQVERSDGILEIASLGFVSLASKSRVSALILGTAHRNEIVCCWLASRSRRIKLLPIVIKFHLFYGPRPLRNQRYGVAHVVEMVPIRNFPNQGKVLNCEQ